MRARIVSSWGLSAVVLVAALGVPPAQAADGAAPSADQVKVAGAEFDLGRKALKEKEYAEAAEHFENADLAAPAIVAIVAAISARDKAGQLDRAATLAALALTRHNGDEKVKQITASLLKRADAELHAVTVRCDSACDVLVGTKLVHGGALTERVVYVAPGEYTFSAGWSEGRTQQDKVVATKGGKSDMSFKAPPLPEKQADAPPVATAAPTAAPSSKPPGADTGVPPVSGGMSPVVFYVGAGLTVALAGVTVWSGLDTKSNPGADAVRDACQSNKPNCQDLYDDGHGRQTRTNVLLGSTLVLGVVTGVIGAFATDWSGGKPSSSARIEPWMSVGGGAAFGARGRF